MSQLDNFMAVLTGRFDNTEQYEQFKRKGVEDFPLAEHVNTACNEKILHLPEGFQGIFVVEESYYTVGKKTHASPHLFLFTQEPEGIKLTSVSYTHLDVYKRQLMHRAYPIKNFMSMNKL